MGCGGIVIIVGGGRGTVGAGAGIVFLKILITLVGAGVTCCGGSG
jgi:hypothetical protein